MLIHLRLKLITALPSAALQHKSRCKLDWLAFPIASVLCERHKMHMDALEKREPFGHVQVEADKQSEVLSGADGSWVAHPDLVRKNVLDFLI